MNEIREYKGTMRKAEDLIYAIFILGYDLLQNELLESENRLTDLAYQKCCKIATDFIESEYNVPTKGLYTCLQEYINDNQYDDLNN